MEGISYLEFEYFLKCLWYSVAAKDHGKESSFICFILSHGGKDNKIYTSDCKCIQLETLIDIADADDLQGKPKIFVVQVLKL